MTALFPADPYVRIDNRHRAAAIKQRVTVADVAERHDADLRPLTSGYEAACPSCERGRVVISAAADHYRCRSCGAAGDAVNFERAVTGAGFSAACDALDAAFPPASDTAELFEAGS